MRILVADSSLVTRQLVMNCLAGLALTDVVQAVDGEEALKLLDEKNPVELVITSWTQTRLDGLDLLRAIQAKMQPKRVPIIVLTENVDPAHAVEAAKEGVIAFVIKPFQIETLQEKIRACLKNTEKNKPEGKE